LSIQLTPPIISPSFRSKERRYQVVVCKIERVRIAPGLFSSVADLPCKTNRYIKTYLAVQNAHKQMSTLRRCLDTSQRGGNPTIILPQINAKRLKVSPLTCMTGFWYVFRLIEEAFCFSAGIGDEDCHVITIFGRPGGDYMMKMMQNMVAMNTKK
jgi:hypothetical protein